MCRKLDGLRTIMKTHSADNILILINTRTRRVNLGYISILFRGLSDDVTALSRQTAVSTTSSARCIVGLATKRESAMIGFPQSRGLNDLNEDSMLD